MSSKCHHDPTSPQHIMANPCELEQTTASGPTSVAPTRVKPRQIMGMWVQRPELATPREHEQHAVN
jgi:hypothetical protein